MNQDLVMNLVPIELKASHIKIHISADSQAGPYTINATHVGLGGAEEKASWGTAPFPNSSEFEVTADHTSIMKRLIGKALLGSLRNEGLIVSSDFIGSPVALEFSHESAKNETNVYKRYYVRILAPRDQFACKGHHWHLNVSYGGETEVTKTSLSAMPHVRDAISKVVVDGRLKRLTDLTVQEASSNSTRAVVSRDARKILGFEVNFTRIPNKYSKSYDESLRFYSKYLHGRTIENLFSVFETGFQPVSESQIFKATKNSNLLLFGNNRTHFNPYNGLKEYGPFQPADPGHYRFFFIFHKQDADHANKLYSCLNKGLKGFPGLNRFVGLELKLDKEKTISFLDDDPIAEISARLNQIQLEENTRYIAIYISRIKKDDADETKRNVYFRLKKLLLEKNIGSQVVYKSNIDLPNFNYFLPNIAIAILAKLGGIPWRLSRPIKHDLVVGLGAFRNIDNNVFLGTTVAFKNDGTFIRFDSSQVSSVDDLVVFFQSILSSVPKEWPEVKRLVIHFYKDMNAEEEKAVLSALNSLGLKIPYVIAHIVEDTSLLPFDSAYSGKMPTSGTCVILRKGDYLLCNNTRYADVTGSKIDDFPFPVRIKISKASVREMAQEDIQQLIDQVYQFSRMYWVSVKQKGKPVTILYSERVAEMSAAFEGQALPHSDLATRTLWFL